jgi:hypothetical protein
MERSGDRWRDGWCDKRRIRGEVERMSTSTSASAEGQHGSHEGSYTTQGGRERGGGV